MDEHDLGLRHDMALMNRRRVLLTLGAAGLGALAAGCAARAEGSDSAAAGVEAAAATASIADAAPQETNGPYPGDGTNGPNVLIESGVVRRDITTSFGSYSGTAKGVPATVTLTMQDLARNGAAGAGMAVYIWQCDREGRYSLYSEGVTDQNYLRGVQVADADGKLTFDTIFPACYPGRWPHFHFEVFDSLESAVSGSDARLTSQIALPEDVCNTVYDNDSGYSASIGNLAALSLDTDSVFGDGWTAEMATVTGSPATALNVALTVGVAEKSQNVMTETGPAGAPPPMPR